jgi:predicted PurR-regulated permease PerM
MLTRERHALIWLAALIVLIGVIALLRGILLPFIVGIVLAYFLNPAADALERWGINRSLSAVTLVGLMVLLLALLLTVLVPVIAEQLRQLAIAWPDLSERLKQSLETFARERLGAQYPKLEIAIDRAVTEVQATIAGSAASLVGSIWSGSLAVVNMISLLLITPVVVFYLLVDWHRLLERVDALLPREHEPVLRRLAGDINAAIAAFIRGQGSICIVLGIFYAIALTLAGIRYGLVVGLATGLLGFVPIVGWVIGLLTALALAVAQGWPSLAPAAWVAGIFAAGMAIDSAFLSPRLVGEKVGLHPVWMIFALLAFSYLFGFVGTLVAVPVSAAIAVVVRFFFDAYVSSTLYTGGPQVPR